MFLNKKVKLQGLQAASLFRWSVLVQRSLKPAELKKKTTLRHHVYKHSVKQE